MVEFSQFYIGPFGSAELPERGFSHCLELIDYELKCFNFSIAKCIFSNHSETLFDDLLTFLEVDQTVVVCASMSWQKCLVEGDQAIAAQHRSV